MQTGQRFILVELFDQLLAGSFEVGGVFRSPPVRKLSLRVKFRAAVVEAMADLVPNRRAHGAVVGGGIRFRIEKRRLQNGSGKV